jgi:hypothetical protein
MEVQMNNPIKRELDRMAAQVPQPKPQFKYAFTEIGEQIIASLVKAADDQVAEAEALRVQVMQLASEIGVQLEKQAKALATMNERTKAFGLDVVEAHKKFLNGCDDAG